MSKFYLFCFAVVLVLMAVPLFSAEEDNFLQDYLLSYPETIYAGATAPFSWQKDNWLQASAIVITGGC